MTGEHRGTRRHAAHDYVDEWSPAAEDVEWRAAKAGDECPGVEEASEPRTRRSGPAGSGADGLFSK